MIEHAWKPYLGRAMAALVALSLLAACEEEGPAERLGEKVDETVSEAADTAEDVADEIKE